MRRLALSAAILFLSTPAAFAESGAIPPTPLTVALIIPSVEATVVKNEALLSDQGCGAAGVKIYDSVAQKIGLVRNSSGVLKNLLAQTDSLISQLEADASHCIGTCKEVNLVSTVTATVPNSWGKIGSCTDQKPQILEHDFATTDDLQSYLNSTLKGKNAEGQQLASTCPNTCAYHIATAITPKSANSQHLTLSVLCGPPRSGSLLFAQYYFSTDLIQQWSCHKN